MQRISLALALLLGCGAVSAGDLNASLGKEHLELELEQAISPAISLQGGLLTNFDSKDAMINIGLAYRVPVGAAQIRLGAKANWLSLDGRSDEMTMSFGGDARVPLGNQLALYGGAYWGPVTTGQVDSNFESRIGLNWQISAPVNLDLGYRYASVEFDDGHKLQLADGFYGGIGVRF